MKEIIVDCQNEKLIELPVGIKGNVKFINCANIELIDANNCYNITNINLLGLVSLKTLICFRTKIKTLIVYHGTPIINCKNSVEIRKCEL